MRDSLRKRTASASTSKANSSEDLFSDVQLSRNSMAAMNAVAYAPEEEEQSRSSGRKSLVAGGVFGFQCSPLYIQCPDISPDN